MSDKIASNINPRGKAVKSTEMTIRRVLALIKVFDELPPEARDWSDAEPKDLRNAMGDGSFDPTLAVYPELWRRYKDGTLQQSVLDLVEAIDLEKISKKARKEIEDGINRITNG
jgi:hypothetical protein